MRQLFRRTARHVRVAAALLSTNSWSQGANMPFDDWGMAASGSGNKLQIAGGVTAGSQEITNKAVEYHPSTNTWSRLPSANGPEYRGGGCRVTTADIHAGTPAGDQTA